MTGSCFTTGSKASKVKSRPSPDSGRWGLNCLWRFMFQRDYLQVLKKNLRMLNWQEAYLAFKEIKIQFKEMEEFKITSFLSKCYMKKEEEEVSLIFNRELSLIIFHLYFPYSSWRTKIVKRKSLTRSFYHGISFWPQRPTLKNYGKALWHLANIL